MRSRNDILCSFAQELERYAADIRVIGYGMPDDVDEAYEKFLGVLELTVQAQGEYMEAGRVR